MSVPPQDFGVSSLLTSAITRIMGLSVFASLFSFPEASYGYLYDTLRLFILGLLVEFSREFFQWLVGRVRFQYSIKAQFTEGDPTFEWIVAFLTEEKIWKRSREFRVNAKSSARRWGIALQDASEGSDHVDLVPTYMLPHLFRWKGFWIEAKREMGSTMSQPPFGGFSPGGITLTMYTLDVNILQAFLEAARVRYMVHGRSSVIIHSASQPAFGPAFVWNSVKRKIKRPLDSIILAEGVVDSILKDARDFIELEDWYIEAGIPHRRGYLLYGPPGTGKTSTIHALAGELGMEIFSLSLSAGFVDDAFLQQAASSIPKKAIFLIEDIDCAFPSRVAEDEVLNFTVNSGVAPTRGHLGHPLLPLRGSSVTLSGLLNVIDGIGSEEGVLFFATTNFIERLDSALVRPGRVDRKVEYKLTTRHQAASLFTRFFPASRTTLRDGGFHVSDSEMDLGSDDGLVEKKRGHGSAVTGKIAKVLAKMAEQFGDQVPEGEFTVAELQGYLLSCKMCPENAVGGVGEWVRRELQDRRSKMDGGAHRRGRRVAIPDPAASSSMSRRSSSLRGSSRVVAAPAPDSAITPPSTPPMVHKAPSVLTVGATRPAV